MSEMFSFHDGIAPDFVHNGESYYRIHGIDKDYVAARHLFIASNIGVQKNFSEKEHVLGHHEWIATGTFRNSLYLEPLVQLTRIRELKLHVDVKGSVLVKLMCATHGHPTATLIELKLNSSSRAQHLVNVGSPTDMPENSRLFWHIETLGDSATVYDICYVTNSTPRKDCRLAVMLRTFGRTTDVKSILKRFADAAKKDAFYASILNNVNFWVLDTTADCESEYDEDWQKYLNLRVMVGPNLGGGGNAGHMLKIFDEACQASSQAPTELLMLDDDLTLSVESLARYFMFCAYREKESICSVPILMKSRPTVVWEDGGFWGRMNFHEGGSFNRKRNLFPNLLKHGRQLDGYEHLDGFATLNTCEYSTFIFFGLSMKMLRKLGYPASFFLRGDDIELSLRAQEAGVQMITNPNLAAWHEPAHSYGQEYMAIMHGVIINLTYSDHDVEFYARFFEERLFEHALIDDAAAIGLYQQIIDELGNPESEVLSDNFQGHYIRKLKEFGAIKMTRLAEVDRVTFEERARANNVLLVPFVYPGYHKNVKNFKSVVVINYGAKAYREVEPMRPADKTRMLGLYLQSLTKFVENFDTIREHWQSRLKVTSKESYWNDIRATFKDQTKDIFYGSRVGLPVIDESTSAASVTTSAFDPRLAEFSGGGSADKKRSLFKKLTNSSKSSSKNKQYHAVNSVEAKPPVLERATSSYDLELDALPPDFDPSVYLDINEDVRDSNRDATAHYLKFGRKEGRKYRR